MTTEQIATLQHDITEIAARLEATRKALARLAAEPPAIAVAIPRPTKGAELAERVAAALRERPRTLGELVLETGATPKAVTEAARGLPIYDLGTPTAPVWTILIGDEGDTADLIEKVEQIISVRPMTLQELADATGARRNRISGALVKIQARGRAVENHGSQKIARWYAPPKRRA